MSDKKDQIDDNPSRKNRGKAETSRPAASVNMDELRELIALLRENGLAEFELEREDFRVRLRRESAAPPPYPGEMVQPVAQPARPAVAPSTPAVPAPVHPGAQAETAASEDQDLHIIPSPIVGTFYRAPSPNVDPFVKIGSNVGPESVVCIIEAMKLMNEIQAEASGEVVKIYVENGQPVEYGQPLFGIKS
jgi:acetyl-CoA carboxylase biotin carboxyl carrier protein